MKKITLIFVSILEITVFTCCKKEATELADDQISLKVNTWLEKHKVQSQPNKAANIDLLMKNLEYSSATVEESDNGEEIIIIPINERLKTAKPIDKESILSLVLIVNHAGVIRKGNVVLYTPGSNSPARTIPRNTFRAIYNTAEPPVDGKFRFLSVTGRWLYELTYKNNILYSAGEITQKPIFSSNNQIAAVVCTDWYLVTTYYYEDGSTYTTREYVGTTCDGCDQDMYMGLCPANDGGGQVENEEEYEYAVGRSMKWKVLDDPADPESSKDIESVERIKGKRVASEPQGGHFTSASHFWDDCMFCTSNDTWNRYINYSIPTPQSISCNISGNLIYNGQSRGVNQTNFWSFTDVF